MFNVIAVSIVILTAPSDYPRGDMLIEAAAIKSNVDSLLILDARPRKDYDAGHIAGAVWIDVKAWDKGFASPDAGEWARRLGDTGIEPTADIAVCGGDDVRDAARAWWILSYWGARQVRLLNGGWSAWVAAGGGASTEAVVPRPKIVRLTPKFSALATKAQVIAGLKADPPQLIDARSSDEHCGIAPTAKRNGRIPDAIHLEWSQAIDAKSKKFKPPEELAALIRERKIDLDKPTVTYCQGGGRAAVVAFMLELMGGKQVRNYYKSWSEWGNADDTPIEVLKKK